ncbi:MAG TPA: hypothetical protein PKD48_01975 [Sphingopyxis sp.]|nr:hypothetical protein [Sphingopyxis sp.]
MKSLSDYLKTPTERRNDGAKKLLAMAKGKMKKAKVKEGVDSSG